MDVIYEALSLAQNSRESKQKVSQEAVGELHDIFLSEGKCPINSLNYVAKKSLKINEALFLEGLAKFIVLSASKDRVKILL